VLSRQAGVRNRLVRDLSGVSRIHSDHLEMRMELCDLRQYRAGQAGCRKSTLMTPARTMDSQWMGRTLFVQADVDRVETS